MKTQQKEELEWDSFPTCWSQWAHSNEFKKNFGQVQSRDHHCLVWEEKHHKDILPREEWCETSAVPRLLLHLHWGFGISITSPWWWDKSLSHSRDSWGTAALFKMLQNAPHDPKETSWSSSPGPFSIPHIPVPTLGTAKCKRLFFCTLSAFGGFFITSRIHIDFEPVLFAWTPELADSGHHFNLFSTPGGRVPSFYF